MERQSNIPVICLVGATGTGKSAAGVALAAVCNGVVVNYDSRQVYRDFPIITAQPAREERARCGHRLYGMLSCMEKLSAGQYAVMAAQEIEEVASGGHIPILVGGTGLYLEALLGGIAAIPPVPERIALHWQERCTNEGPHKLHELLRECDPALAARLHPHDSQRIIRGLEVYEATGKALSWWQMQPVPPSRYAPLQLGFAVELAALTPYLGERIERMLAAGAIAEAEAALRICGDSAAPGWSGIGCAELYRYVLGEISLGECKALWLKNTRAYAKRQNTWFRRDTTIRWFAAGDVQGMAGLAAHFVLTQKARA